MMNAIRRHTRWILLGVGVLIGTMAGAAIPPAEQVLPDETLILVTVPDCSKLKDIYQRSPGSKFWNDVAMKPFKDKLMTKWDEELVRPLERELGVKMEEYTSLLQGQVTFAVVRTGGDPTNQDFAAWVLLVDSRDKSSQLKSNLATLRKKWVDAGKTIRSEKIRTVEFSVLPLSTNDVPKTLLKLFPSLAPGETEEGGKPAKTEVVLGQYESLLILGESVKGVEKIMTRLTGGGIPPLAEYPAYQANHQALFRDASIYAWVNVKSFIDIALKELESRADPSDPVNAAKALSVAGLTGLKTLAVNFQHSPEGTLFQVFLGVPESTRQGLFKILAGEAKDATPPPFVPADAVTFQRWRIDGQKAWATIEKALTELSPQFSGALTLMINTANNALREKDPNFDLRKNLIGNLGNDLIEFAKPRRAGSETNEPPSLVLVGSPNAEQFVVALKNILMLANIQAGPPTEREFLGRKIYTAALPSLPMAMTGGASSPRQSVSLAASGGYVAISADAPVLEEFLRSGESSAKTLRESPGLGESTQKVIGPGTSYFGYDNQTESMRTVFDTLRKLSANRGASGLGGMSPLPMLDTPLGDWIDFSLLPPYEKVAKYFSFTVYGGSASADGLALKVFSPVPPQLKN